MAPTGTGQRGVLGPGAAFLTKTWTAAPQRLRAPAPGERRGTGPGASYLRLRPACALPAPGRVPGAWCGPRGRRLGGGSAGRGQRAGRGPAPHTYTCGSRRGGRAPPYLQEEAEPGGRGGLGTASRAEQTGGSWPLPGAALRGWKSAWRRSGQRGLASPLGAGELGRFHARDRARMEAGEMGTPAASLACSPGRVAAAR